MKQILRALLQGMTLACMAFLAGCQTAPTMPPLRTVPQVDLQRFMGDWYVVGHIPTVVERGAHNAIESYRLNDDGSIDTTFRFNQNGVDGKVKRYSMRGVVMNTATNAEWAMQFAGPVKADYKIVYLDDNYQEAIIGRDQRDYVWILTRSPNISSTDFDALLTRVRSMGYELNQLRQVPHQPRPPELVAP
jgi:apolipoprotein D and lipocalin family protein